MDPLTVLVGALAIAFGIYTGVMRLVKPSVFGKLEAMKAKFGAAAGSAIHGAAYVIVPLGFGITTLIAGLKGLSLFASGR